MSLEKDLEIPQTSVRLIHGDPHAGNILLHEGEAIFLDPNGFMDGGDIAYDFGKLLVSFDWHDLSMMNMLEPARIKVTPERLEVTNNKIYKNNRIRTRHNVLRQKIMELLVEKVASQYENDPMLLQRIKILLYIHQFSFAPTLIKEKPQTALHILLNAISDYTTLVKENEFRFT
jgi:5-methylthioribose kinase